MGSGKPIIRQIAWISLIPQAIILIVLIVMANLIFGVSSPASDVVILLYFLYPLISRQLVARSHRRGMRFFKAGDYIHAIDEFEKSYHFFMKHPWIDKYRFVVLLSSGRISFTEMALLNTAFCYSQIGEGDRAKHYYEKTLEQFPDSGMAKAALQMLASVR